MPPQVETIKEIPHDNSNEWKNAPLQYYHFFTDKKKTNGNFFSARNEFLMNEHCVISTAVVSEETDLFLETAISTN